MRGLKRDGLLLTLAAAGASLDAWSFFGLGNIFVANMTGNTVLLGYSAVVGPHGRAWRAAISLAAYISGVLAGAVLARPVRQAAADRGGVSSPHPKPGRKLLWHSRANSILALESVLVSVAAIVYGFTNPAPGSDLAAALIALMAFSVGLQSAVVVAMNIPGIVTTYITGTWTTLATGVAQWLDGETRGPDKTEWEGRLALQGATLAAYLLSACLSGLIFHFLGRAWLGASAALLLLTVNFATMRAEHHENNRTGPPVRVMSRGHRS
jgi:uncharacterized membrane protein YoaK (UPF0700 family)